MITCPVKETPRHPAHCFEIQGVNLFEQARSAITTAEYDRIKLELRQLFRTAYDAAFCAKSHRAQSGDGQNNANGSKKALRACG